MKIRMSLNPFVFSNRSRAAEKGYCQSGFGPGVSIPLFSPIGAGRSEGDQRAMGIKASQSLCFLQSEQGFFWKHYKSWGKNVSIPLFSPIGAGRR